MKRRDFLARCEVLGSEPPVFSLAPGRRVARGFADFGYEEFFLVETSKLVSLMTGSLSELSPEHERFFFVIPDVDTMAAELMRRGHRLSSLECESQRDWILCIDGLGVFRAESLAMCFIDALLRALGRTPSPGPGGLRTVKE